MTRLVTRSPVRPNLPKKSIVVFADLGRPDQDLRNGACEHYVMVSKFQWKPFWLAAQRDPQNDWTATQNRVNYDVFAQAHLVALDWRLFTEVCERSRAKCTLFPETEKIPAIIFEPTY